MLLTISRDTRLYNKSKIKNRKSKIENLKSKIENRKSKIGTKTSIYETIKIENRKLNIGNPTLNFEQSKKGQLNCQNLINEANMIAEHLNIFKI